MNMMLVSVYFGLIVEFGSDLVLKKGISSYEDFILPGDLCDALIKLANKE